LEYFNYTHQSDQLTLYPLVCFHLGARQADEEFIKEHIERIAADENARWVYLGDGGECVTKASKGELYDQLCSPDEQIDRLVEILEPVRGKGLFGLSGNHDRRISKLSGLDWTKALCTKLSIPYLGIACFARIRVRERDRHLLSWDTFWHHGVSSSSLLSGKIRGAKKLEELVWADCIFSAHSHICMETPPEYVAYLPNSAREIAYREIRSFICGCAYDSRIPGYAEEKGYKPILPAHLAVTLTAARDHQRDKMVRHIACQIWRKQL